MNFADAVIVALTIALVAFTIIYNLRRRKNNGCSCCEGCRGCCPTADSARKPKGS